MSYDVAPQGIAAEARLLPGGRTQGTHGRNIRLEATGLRKQF